MAPVADLSRPCVRTHRSRRDHFEVRTPPALAVAHTCRGASRPHDSDVTISAALFAGLVSFLSPCVLPLVPPYLVYLAGTSLERLADAEPEPRGQARDGRRGAAVRAGFSTVFVALGASASVIGSLIRAYSAPLAIVAGIVIIIMGLHFLGLTRIALLHRQKRAARWRSRSGCGAPT